MLEREARIELATSSLGKRRSIENSEHSVSRHLVLAMEITGNSQPDSFRTRMEHKWSTRLTTSRRCMISCNSLNFRPVSP
jgi:hypothetical protein